MTMRDLIQPGVPYTGTHTLSDGEAAKLLAAQRLIREVTAGHAWSCLCRWCEAADSLATGEAEMRTEEYLPAE